MHVIAGVGVDIVDIDRIRNSVEHFGDHFLERVYTEREVEYCRKRKDPHPSLAARFAAKEAMIKALPCGDTVPMKDIEVVMDAEGRPTIEPAGHLSELINQNGITGVHLSLSHEKKYAVAYVVLEKH